MTKKAEKSEAPQFEESSEHASLRRIAEAVRERKAAKSAVVAAKENYTAAKAYHKKACEEADQIAEDETTDLPLFPRLKEQPAKPTINAADPKATWLSAVESMPPSAVVKLGEKGIQSVGELGEFTAKGGRLDDVDGIGKVMAEKIADALERFWKGLGGKGAA